MIEFLFMCCIVALLLPGFHNVIGMAMRRLYTQLGRFAGPSVILTFLILMWWVFGDTLQSHSPMYSSVFR